MKFEQPEYTRELVEFLHQLQPGNLPAEVLDRARYFLLDYLACAAAPLAIAAKPGMVRMRVPITVEHPLPSL